MRTVLMAALAAVAILSGCAQKPLTESEFYGFCIMDPQDVMTSCDNLEVCGTYREALSANFTRLEDCLAVCDQVNRSELFQKALRDCDMVIARGYRWCIQYCRRLPQFAPGQSASPAP